ncbi:ImmA/IrrE family metallo-endopeptidase [Bifidobacterium sp. ESL0764]|uniref:ImmA/IrrE family metallo-endopeptidase n=1 Tax=Bifidobacterium sp. ESL0764 TaxID=2983228 RepID=UPI0023F7BC64|nr:ImmA/IrrE family metallo-endopeptidase [Bifidobacterium sp. ESL0764]WEV66361.1 ImmA/IrrE family metallo-endopeptidase [Bifidobacterium sp. ESL0764]
MNSKIKMMSELNPQKIDTLRELNGWTIGQLSEISEIPRRRISDMSKSLTPFRKEDAEALALASGFPISFFSTDEEQTPATELTFRAPSRTNIREKRRVTSEYRMLKNTARKLTKIADLTSQCNWIDAIAPSGTPDINDIEELAAEIRARLGLSASGPIENVIWSLEAGGIVSAPLSVTPSNEAAKPEGVSFPTSKFNPAVIGYFAQRRTGDGIRFTVCHELGHIALQRKRRPESRKIIEREASLFAGAFLIPRKDAFSIFTPKMTLDDFIPIKMQYATSISSEIMRAKQLGIIDADRQKSLMTQMSIRHWRKNEPVEIDEEHPVLFKQLLGNACGNINSATDIEINPGLAEQFTGVPFKYLDIWSDGVRKKTSVWDTDVNEHVESRNKTE